MLKQFFRRKQRGSTLVEVLVSTVIIMSVFFAGSALIFNSAVKKPISKDLKIELKFLSEYHKNPQLIMLADTLRFHDYYLVNDHVLNTENNMIFINVDIYSNSNYLLARHYFLRKKIED